MKSILFIRMCKMPAYFGTRSIRYNANVRELFVAILQVNLVKKNPTRFLHVSQKTQLSS